MSLGATISVSDLARCTREVISRLVRQSGERLIVMKNNQAVAVISGLRAAGSAPIAALPAAESLKNQVMRKSDVLRTIAMAHGVRSMRLFGSAARGDEQTDSDLDFIVELEPGTSLFELAGLRNDLSQLFERQVDVVPRGSLKPRMRADALRESLPIF